MNEIDSFEVARSFACDVGELKNNIQVNKSDLTIISQNIRSIYHNFDDFLLTLSCLTFETDVIILSECRISSHKPIPQIPNYDSYYTQCQLNQNDGVVVYIKNHLQHKIKEIKLCEASCLQLDILNNTVFCIYRSPSNTNADSFIDSLSSHLDALSSTKKGIIVAGDININIRLKPTELPYERKNRINYTNMLAIHGILAGHVLPTREINCLDHFMIKINKLKFKASIAVLHSSITDHCTTFLSISKVKNNTAVNKTKTTVNFEKALEDLKNKNLSELLHSDDPSMIIDSLIYKITETIKSNTVITTIPKKFRIIKPWITPGILRCIQNRNKLQKEVRSQPYNEVKKITYMRYRNYCNKLIKKLKRNYERELIRKTMHNNRQLWKNIKNITYTNNKKSTNAELLNLKKTPIESANFANDYFANIGKKLAQGYVFTNNDTSTYLQSLTSHSHSFVLLQTDHDEVKDVIMNLRTDSAPGWDNIPIRFLKLALSEVLPVITHLVNICFDKGIFPDPLKQSIITPVYKGGDRDSINNYRPISVLPAISKILEKLLNKRLLNYLEKFKILSPSQFGFRKGISTEGAVSALSSLVSEQLDSGNKCLAVFLDLKKAFDTVSHPILVHKLEKIGIRGTPLSLFKDYLSNRRQKVKLGNCVSDCVEVSYGVPQGSVLGPTLFLVYLNDLCDMRIPNAKVFSYADDTAIVINGDTWESVKSRTELALENVDKWLRNNILTLNATKTNYVCFSIYNNTQPSRDFDIKIHNCNNLNKNSNCNCPSIQKVMQTKYLGVIVDQRLTWYAHIEHVNQRIRKLSWIFKTLRHVLPSVAGGVQKPSRNLVRETYVALAQPIMEYCIPIWGGAAKTRFLQVERAQRNLIKIMYFKKIRFSTESLYRLSKLLSIRKLYILHTVLKKHKNLPYNATLRNKRRKDSVIQIPRTKTKFASRQYNKRSAYLYNYINKELGIYDMHYYECKKTIPIWLETKNYNEIEELVK